jgi:hypothetical protein
VAITTLSRSPQMTLPRSDSFLWQMAWYEPRRRIGVYYPAPLNRVFRTLREFGYRLQIALRAPGTEHAQVFELQRRHHEREHLADEYARGYMSGWHECFRVCLDAVEDEIARVDDPFDAATLLLSEAKPRPKN